MAAAIETSGLTKFYGKTPGIVDLDLLVHTGEVFGFLGPNGAGKSTTIRTLLRFLHPTRGSARVLGTDDSLEIRRRTGYLPADLGVYPAMTGRQLVRFLGALRGFDKWRNVEALAARFALDLDRRVGSYSTGNRRKVGIVQAFMHEPELLVLDEPTTGLDPLMQQEFFALIDEVRADGRTVFLSSHVLPEVERLADRVGIVRRSRLVMVEEIEALRSKALRRLEIAFAQPVDAATFASLPGVREAVGTGHGLVLAVEGSLDTVMREAARHGVVNLTSHEADLEEVFMGYYKDDDAAGP
jgi:ABC-2 type transport system ATP-binding protein